MRNQITDPQTGHQDLGEAALENPGSTLQQGADRRLGYPVVIQFAVRLVFDERQAVLIQHGCHILTRLDAITGARRILKTRDEISHPRLMIADLPLHNRQIQPVVGQGDPLTLSLKQVEGLQRRQVSWGLHQNTAVRIDKQLGDQIQTLL